MDSNKATLPPLPIGLPNKPITTVLAPVDSPADVFLRQNPSTDSAKPDLGRIRHLTSQQIELSEKLDVFTDVNFDLALSLHGGDRPSLGRTLLDCFESAAPDNSTGKRATPLTWPDACQADSSTLSRLSSSDWANLAAQCANESWHGSVRTRRLACPVGY